MAHAKGELVNVEVRCPRTHFIGEFDLLPGTIHFPRCHRCQLKFRYVVPELQMAS